MPQSTGPARRRSRRDAGHRGSEIVPEDQQRPGHQAAQQDLVCDPEEDRMDDRAGYRHRRQAEVGNCQHRRHVDEEVGNAVPEQSAGAPHRHQGGAAGVDREGRGATENEDLGRDHRRLPLGPEQPGHGDRRQQQQQRQHRVQDDGEQLHHPLAQGEQLLHPGGAGQHREGDLGHRRGDLLLVLDGKRVGAPVEACCGGSERPGDDRVVAVAETRPGDRRECRRPTVGEEIPHRLGAPAGQRNRSEDQGEDERERGPGHAPEDKRRGVEPGERQGYGGRSPGGVQRQVDDAQRPEVETPAQNRHRGRVDRSHQVVGARCREQPGGLVAHQRVDDQPCQGKGHGGQDQADRDAHHHARPGGGRG